MDAKQTLGEPRLLIARDAMLHNASLVRQALDAVRPGIRICAIIKANAYGHGARMAADTLCGFSTSPIEGPVVDMLAVASIDEAEALGNVRAPVLIFRPVENAFMGRQRRQIETAIRSGWVLTVCSSAAAGDVARIAMTCRRRAAVQIMVDTGMTRSGVSVEDFDEVLETISGHAALRLAGLCTHFANADDPQSLMTIEQIDRFRAATEAPKCRLGNRVLRHAANSGAVFFNPTSHFDMVRPGISLYGIDPTGRPSVDRPLRPVLKWTAPLLSIKELRQGRSVGYGQTWTAPRHTRIGLVPVGYADGYLRCFSNRAVMIVQGKPAPVVGHVSMDLTTLDLGSIPQAAVGDEVTVLDDNPLSPASVYALAQLAGTIPYEIFCRIGSRIHRCPVEARRTPVRHGPPDE